MTNIPNKRSFIRTQPQQSPRRAHALLRAGIRDGLIAPGELLVEDSLVKTLSTSRNSVREALQLLVAENIVSRQAHHGTRTIGQIRRVSLDRPNLRAVAQEPGPARVAWEQLERKVIPVPLIVSAMLNVSPTGQVLVTEHLLTLDESPYALRVAYRPVTQEQLATIVLTPASAQAEIAEVYQRVKRVDATIDAVGSEPRTARLLGIDPGTPLLVHQMTMYDEVEDALELSFVSYHSNRVALSSSALVSPWEI